MNKKIVSMCVCFFMFGFLSQNCAVNFSNINKIDIADSCLETGMGNILLTMGCYDANQQEPLNKFLNFFNPTNKLFDSWLVNTLQLNIVIDILENKCGEENKI